MQEKKIDQSCANITGKTESVKKEDFWWHWKSRILSFYLAPALEHTTMIYVHTLTTPWKYVLNNTKDL